MYGQCIRPPRLKSPLIPPATLDGLSSLTALIQALKDLDDLCVTIDEEYAKSLQSGQFERWDEKS